MPIRGRGDVHEGQGCHDASWHSWHSCTPSHHESHRLSLGVALCPAYPRLWWHSWHSWHSCPCSPCVSVFVAVHRISFSFVQCVYRSVFRSSEAVCEVNERPWVLPALQDSARLSWVTQRTPVHGSIREVPAAIPVRQNLIQSCFVSRGMLAVSGKWARSRSIRLKNCQAATTSWGFPQIRS